MYSIRAEHGKVKYGVQDLIFDVEADFREYEKRPNNKIAIGSTAFIVESSVRYMLNNAREWVKVVPGCGASSSTSGGGAGGGGTTPGDDTVDVEVIYDGGDQDMKNS